MKLNVIEKALMNNPARAAVQSHYEARLLQRLGGLVTGETALEIGCGRGVGVQIILERFAANHVDAFDLDADMIEQARRRLRPYGNRVRLWTGDASEIDAADSSYDAVFDFGIIHHVPQWHAAVAEVARVLRPGGRFFFEEVTRHALERWSYRTFLEHPQDDRFEASQFVDALERSGIAAGDRWLKRFFGDFVLGVGRRRDSSKRPEAQQGS